MARVRLKDMEKSRRRVGSDGVAVILERAGVVVRKCSERRARYTGA